MQRIAIIALVLVACGSPPPPPTSESAAALPPVSVVSAEPEAPQTMAAYELHEWGVIDVPISGELHVTSGPERRILPPPVVGTAHARKPVIYVHLLDGAAEATFGLRVTLARGGAFRELSPQGTVTGETLAWSQIVARREHCDTNAHLNLPIVSGHPACDTVDHVCEARELALYDAPSAACVTVGDETAGLLFYRAASPASALPITATRAADLTLSVTANASLVGSSGGLLRISHSLAGRSVPAAMTIARAAFPTVLATVTIAAPTDPLVRADAISELRRGLTERGLSDDEASAFLTAWDCELFGTDPTLPAHAGTVLHPLVDSLLYFLPPGAVDGVARLDATPPPRAVHRAFLVRVDLGAVPTD